MKLFFVYSHEVRPAYLEIIQIDELKYDVFFKIPSLNDRVPKLEVVFPSGTIQSQASTPKILPNFAVFFYQIETKTPLEGEELFIDGLEKTLIEVLVRVKYLNGNEATILVRPDKPKFVVPGETSWTNVAKTYTIIGVEHIVFGFDHLLFVLGLVFLASTKWKILKTITAFTLAHSITLSLAALGYVDFPSAPVEAVIALSIVFLAYEIIIKSKGKITLASSKPWLVAFIFGLLHGLGFAGALSDIGLPPNQIPLSLAFFNIGVELGQVGFVLVIFAFLWLLNKNHKIQLVLPTIVAYFIGGTSMYWLIDRVVGF